MAIVAGSRHGATALDSTVWRFLLEHRTHTLNSVMKAVTAAGSGVVLTPLAVIGAGVAGWRARSWLPAVFVAVTTVGVSLLTTAFKILFARPRPPAALAEVTAGGWAFPSGHAANTTAVVGVLAVVAWTQLTSRRARWLTTGVAALVVLAVGTSRLYLGVHWLTDVAAGYLMAGCWLAAALATLGPYCLGRDRHPAHAVTTAEPTAAHDEAGHRDGTGTEESGRGC
ncbi:phosphatase PAP2 family protein [Longispora fulva]|nr:phosphatase PAP2 family protein [Longispora fulva]